MQELLLELPSEELIDVHTTREQLEAIDRRLDRIEERLGISPTPPEQKKSFWPKTLTDWATVFGFGLALLIACISVTLGIGSLLFDSHITTDIKPLSDKIDQDQRDIAKINGKLDAWAPFIAPAVIQRSTTLSQEEFNRSLPALNKALQATSQLQVAIPKEAVQQIAQKLQKTTETSADYWPTVLQFIQAASASLVAPSDVPPPDTKFAGLHNFRCVGATNCMVASHCAVILDGGDIPNSIFDHCRIRFTNNPVGLAGTRFTDCVFEMPAGIVQPTPYLKNSAKTLLASNLHEITFPN
jgi:hypothetical protein